MDLAELLADASDGPAERDVAPDLGDAIVLAAPGRTLDGQAADLTFIPYHAWGNRGLATMRVWVPAA